MSFAGPGRLSGHVPRGRTAVRRATQTPALVGLSDHSRRSTKIGKKLHAIARRMRERQEHYLRFARDPLPRPRCGRTCRRLVPAPLHVGHSALYAELTNAEHSLGDGYVHMQLDGCQQLLHEPTGGESSRRLRAAGRWSPCCPRGGASGRRSEMERRGTPEH